MFICTYADFTSFFFSVKGMAFLSYFTRGIFNVFNLVKYKRSYFIYLFI